MTSRLTGHEPFLSGVAALPPQASGDEPGLGGAHRVNLIRQHVIALLESPKTTHLRRAAIGDWLATVDDLRPGVGLRADGLPDLLWCPVSQGAIDLRDVPLLNTTYRPFPVDRFYIARYPVTWAQYRIFLEAEDGHADPTWWEGLRRRDEYERTDIPTDNHPVQEASWYDAVAYCRWLSERIGYPVRLPNEWEWEQAATGGDQKALFAWGAEWDSSKANTRESLLRRVTAVGLYPDGESPVGASDMTGTVLEWCANEFAEPSKVDPTSTAHRVVRGGSWFLIHTYARTMFRTGYDPYHRYNSVGFRLACDVDEPRPAAMEADVEDDLDADLLAEDFTEEADTPTDGNEPQ